MNEEYSRLDKKKQKLCYDYDMKYNEYHDSLRKPDGKIELV